MAAEPIRVGSVALGRAIGLLPLLTVVLIGCAPAESPPAEGEPAAAAGSGSSTRSAGARQLAARPDRTPATRHAARTQPIGQRGDDSSVASTRSADQLSETPGPHAAPGDADRSAASDASAPPARRRSAASFADLMTETSDSVGRFMPDIPRMRIDEPRVANAGIRKLSGRHLTLYTDVPASEEIERLPAVFDQAIAQWCDYFGLDPADHADWHCTAFLMRDAERFHRAGLLPESLPDFPHGYSRNYEFWLYDQPSDYYRRHLLLHEGTHSFMNTLLGACGPPWYMEGVAELLATHELADGRLTLNVMPRSAEDVPMWGRVRLIKDAFEQRRAMRLKQVVDYPAAAHRETEPYAWCWALAKLLDTHPAYRGLFRDLSGHVTEGDFTQRFKQAVGARWPELAVQWQVFVAGVEYGYDIPRSVIDFRPGEPLSDEGTDVVVAADRGWQNSGWHVEAGRPYRLRARGRFQIADQSRPWPCEPGGVTLRYYDGRPLGELLAAVHPDDQNVVVSPLLRPTPIGLDAEWTPEHSGTLLFKINDSGAELVDNAGEVTVQIVPR